MAVNFYISNKGESGWVKDKVFTNDVYEQFIEEIKIIMSTKGGDVLGCEDMDGDIESFIFKRYIDVKEIQSKIKNQIATYSTLAREFNYTIDVKFTEIEGNKICLILMDIAHYQSADVKERVRIVFS